MDAKDIPAFQDLVYELKYSLLQVVSVLKKSEIPAYSDIIEIEVLLKRYLDMVDNKQEAVTNSIRIKKNGNSRGNFEIIRDALIESDELTELLHYFGLVKIVDKSTNQCDKDLIKKLIDLDLITEISINDNKLTGDYLILSEVGCKCFNNPLITNALGGNAWKLHLPKNHLCLNESNINIETLIGILTLQEYYKSSDSKTEYAIFFFNNNTLIPFGCRIESMVDKCYDVSVSGWDFREQHSSLNELKTVRDDLKIDRITIVTKDRVERDILQNDYGMDTGAYSGLSFCILEEK